MTVWPNGSRTRPDMSVGYGGYSGHNGTDFINFDYNCATDSGTVVYSGWNPSGAGYEVRISHAGYISRYLHNAAVLVNFGDWVAAGQRIGIQGSTGDSTGKHVHYEVWPGGNINNRVDPVPYLTSLISSTAGGGTTPFPPVDPEEAKRLERIRRAKGMSYLCTPTTDWAQRPLMSDGKTPISVVWDGPNSTLIDTADKLYTAQRMHRTDEDRKIVDQRDWAWLISLLPSAAVDVDEAALANALAPFLKGATKAELDASLAAAVIAIKSAIPTRLVP